MPWLSLNTYVPTDKVRNDMFNSLANDDRNWGGNVNGGGNRLSNVILDGTGGFQFYASPLQVTPGADGQGVVQMDQTVGANQIARWTAGKTATAESGANAGSDYAIVRYDDAGALLGTPFQIARSTGLITMGAQKWTGAIDGGGQTLSNITIAGVASDPTTTKGDLIARGAAVLGRLAVGTNGQALVADSAQTLGMKWATTDPTTTLGDLIVRGAAAVGRLGVGTNGQVLQADSTQTFGVKWAAAATTASYSKDGTLVGTRPGFNVITGANVVLTMAVDSPNNRVNLTIAAAGGGSGGMVDPTTTLGDLIVRGSAAPVRFAVGSNGQVLTADSSAALGVKWAVGGGGQTPWTSDINAANFGLWNLRYLAIGAASLQPSPTVGFGVAGSSGLTSVVITETLSTGQAGFTLNANVAQATFMLSGSAASVPNHLALSNNTGGISFWTGTERLRITATGNVGINITTPGSLLHLAGNGAVDTPQGVITMSRFWPDASNVRASALFHYYNSAAATDLLAFGVSGDGGGSTTAPGQISNAKMVITAGGYAGIGTTTPTLEAAMARLVVTGIAAQVASNLATSNTKALASFRANSSSGYTLAIGAESGNSFPYLQAVNWNGGSSAASLLLNPFGGNIGMLKINPAYALDVAGDVNCTGAFRVNGVAIGGAQTPWTGDVDAAGHALNNVSAVYSNIASVGGTGKYLIFGCPLATGDPGTMAADTIAFWRDSSNQLHIVCSYSDLTRHRATIGLA